MNVLLKGASPSLYWEQEPNTGGFRCRVRAFLTCQDFVFWWDLPGNSARNSYFYGKDLRNIVQNIRQGAGSGVLPFIKPNFDDPSLDDVRSYSILIHGVKMSEVMGYSDLCPMSANNDVIDIAIRRRDPTIIYAQYTTLAHSDNLITTYNYANRNEDNALCSFRYGYSYHFPTTFIKV